MSKLLELLDRRRIPNQLAAESAASRAATLYYEIERDEAAHALAMQDAKESHKKEMATKVREYEDLTEALEIWLRNNEPELLTDKRRSLSLKGHLLALRDNGGSVSVAPKKKLAAVVDRLVELASAGDEVAEGLITIKTVLDKTAVERLAKDTPAALADYWLRFEHEDLFSFTPNGGEEAV